MNKIALREIIAAIIIVLFFHAGAPAEPSQCVSVEPASGLAGGTLNVTITGADTHFDETSVVTFTCEGITINSVTVNSATELVAAVSIPDEAPYCEKGDVIVTSGSAGTETVTCKSAFAVNSIVGDCIFGLILDPGVLRAGFLLPRLYCITMQILRPCEFSQDSIVKIQDIRMLKVLTITPEQMSMLVLVPGKFRIAPGPKMVTVQTGLTIFTGKLVIQ